jgi:hypothetical protein
MFCVDPVSACSATTQPESAVENVTTIHTLSGTRTGVEKSADRR